MANTWNSFQQQEDGSVNQVKQWHSLQSLIIVNVYGHCNDLFNTYINFKRNWGTERLGHLPKVKQPGSDLNPESQALEPILSTLTLDPLKEGLKPFYSGLENTCDTTLVRGGGKKDFKNCTLEQWHLQKATCWEKRGKHQDENSGGVSGLSDFL